MNIYLGNLSYKVKSEDLTALVAQYGAATNARIIMDRETGRSRGFGFVEMSDDDALAAIEALNEQEFMGRKLIVKEAQERPERAPRRY
ncbi:MAG: RNA-binding protein [Bacteroidales bacterium]|nr:RNA-binding protein [Porphyromonas sp.]MDD6934484.1 RNA-binding protein [Bacteroidales bacterium]MDY3102280.1 RNA-binding protein [Porphyromonas sp.]